MRVSKPGLRPEAERGPLRRPALPELPLRGYRLERLTDAFFSAGLALMEGGFIGVIADKLFHVHPAVLALVTAAPMFGNLSSSFWARLAHGRRRVPWTASLMAAFAACIAGIALIPEGAFGAAAMVTLLIASRLLLGGIITLRSIVWTLNYPREARGRVIARLSIISTLSLAAASWIGAQILNANPQSFRLVYVGGAFCAALGVLAFSRVPLLGEADHLAQEQRASHGGGSVLALLRGDPLYASFLGWQMLSGISNMMVEAPVLYLVSRQMGASYAESIAVTTVIPLVLSVLTTPFWALYLDRVHVSAFRAMHAWSFSLSQMLLWAGAATQSLLIVLLARMVLGSARAGGGLAWNLGHNDFAPPDRVGIYMGVHVTLTGMRGAVAPFLGMALYLGWAAHPLPGGVSLPAWDGLGEGLMPLAALMSAVSALGFRSLQRRISALQG
ncbi:MAG TPA: MFS transporter [Myxococcota bacterium]|nr:MFS transporter [Myxococcota bacterium]